MTDLSGLYEACGFISGILNAVMLIPQMYHSYKFGSTEGLSIHFLALDLIAGTTGIVYAVGIFIDNPRYGLPFVITAPIGLLCTITLLIMAKRSVHDGVIAYTAPKQRI